MTELCIRLLRMVSHFPALNISFSYHYISLSFLPPSLLPSLPFFPIKNFPVQISIPKRMWQSLRVHCVLYLDPSSIPGLEDSPGVGRFPWRREWVTTPIFLRICQRTLAGYSPWSCKELDMTERPILFTFPWNTHWNYLDVLLHDFTFFVAQLIKNPPAMQKTWVQSLEEDWAGKMPWRRKMLPTLVFWLGEFHGLYNPWGCKELDTTEWLSLFTFTYHHNFFSVEYFIGRKLFICSTKE